MAALVMAIINKQKFRVKTKSILTSREVFANHLPTIVILNGNNESTGCARGGREQYAIILSFFLNVYGFKS